MGHNAIVHGCTVHDNVLIGMGAIVMDNCEIGSNTIIAAGAVVTEGTKVPSGCVFAGVPAKKVKDISEELINGEINRIAVNCSCTVLRERRGRGPIRTLLRDFGEIASRIGRGSERRWRLEPQSPKDMPPRYRCVAATER